MSRAVDGALNKNKPKAASASQPTEPEPDEEDDLTWMIQEAIMRSAEDLKSIDTTSAKLTATQEDADDIRSHGKAWIALAKKIEMKLATRSADDVLVERLPTASATALSLVGNSTRLRLPAFSQAAHQTEANWAWRAPIRRPPYSALPKSKKRPKTLEKREPKYQDFG